MEELINLLKSINPEPDYENETRLVDKGLLNSLNILELISGISDLFDIEISPRYIVPENFNSARNIMGLIEKISEEE